jgi:hypothetical protein
MQDIKHLFIKYLSSCILVLHVKWGGQFTCMYDDRLIRKYTNK